MRSTGFAPRRRPTECVRVVYVPFLTPYVRSIPGPGFAVRNRGARSDRGSIPDDVSLSWIRTHLADERVDVLHLQFFELDPPEAVDAVLDLCRQRGVTIAVTIHDLQPMFSDPVEFRKGIERTTGAASYVFTLTPGARDALVRDFALDVSHLRVVPHGNVLDLSSPYWEQTHHSARCITFGVYGAIRPNRGVAELLRVWRGFAAGRDVRLRLLLRATADRLSQDEMEEVEALLAMVPEASLDRLTLGWVRPTDGQIVEFLRGCDVVILPYRWGSHSGQLELGFDLNLTIVAPDIGFYREQYEPKAGLVQEPVWFSWTPRSHQLDLVAALQDAEQRARWRGGLEMSGLRAFRIAERELIRAEHLRCYRGRPT